MLRKARTGCWSRKLRTCRVRERQTKSGTHVYRKLPTAHDTLRGRQRFNETKTDHLKAEGLPVDRTTKMNANEAAVSRIAKYDISPRVQGVVKGQ